MKYLPFYFLFYCCLVACKREKDPLVFDMESSAVYFAVKDTTAAYSKFLKVVAFRHNGQWANREHILPIPIQLIGSKSERDRRVNVSFDERFSTFDEGQIKLSQPIIQAGQSQDTLYITLHNLDESYSHYPYLTLNINETSDFGVVVQNSRLAIVYSEFSTPLSFIQTLEDFIFSDL